MQTLFISFFWRQVPHFLFYEEQLAAICLPLQCRRAWLVFLRQRLHRLVKLAPQVHPAAHHSDVLRQAVVTWVAVRMEPAREPFQESLRVAGFPVRSVLVEHHRIAGMGARPVKPHIALGLGGFPRLLQYLERCLIRVKHIFPHQPAVHFLVDRHQPIV